MTGDMTPLGWLRHIEAQLREHPTHRHWERMGMRAAEAVLESTGHEKCSPKARGLSRKLLADIANRNIRRRRRSGGAV